MESWLDDGGVEGNPGITITDAWRTQKQLRTAEMKYTRGRGGRGGGKVSGN